jgi:hypothetical protein
VTNPLVDQDKAIFEAMRALAAARMTVPQDPAAVEKAREDLRATRKARGY